MTTTSERASFDAAVARAAARAWRRRQHDLICDRVERWAHGRLVRATAHPAYWDYNTVLVDEDAPDLTAEAVADVADVGLADLPHRQIQVEDERAGERLRPGLEARGYRHTPLLYMGLASPPPAPDPAIRFRTAEDDVARPLREQWYAAEPWVTDDGVLREFLEAERRVHATLGGHVLVVDGPGPGGLAAYVRVRAGGETGEIEEAYAIPQARGRGVGGALVAAGARAIAATPGVRHVLIVADADDRPRRLYARLGFRPLWVVHQFTRTPPAA